MRRFPPVRILAAIALMTLFSLTCNGLVHGFVLTAWNQVLVDIGQPAAERSPVLGVGLTVGLATLFVISLASTGRLDRRGRIGWRCGLLHGLFFASTAGLMVDLNQYLLYPPPARVPVAWFVAGVFEFSLAGWLTCRAVGTSSGASPASAGGTQVT